MSALYSEPEQAFAVLTILDTVGEFFQASEKESFTKQDIQDVLRMLQTHPGFIEPEAFTAYQQEVAYMETRTVS